MRKLNATENMVSVEIMFCICKIFADLLDELNEDRLLAESRGITK